MSRDFFPVANWAIRIHPALLNQSLFICLCQWREKRIFHFSLPFYSCKSNIFFFFLAGVNEVLRYLYNFENGRFETYLWADFWVIMPLTFLFTFSQIPMLMKHGFSIDGEENEADQSKQNQQADWTGILPFFLRCAQGFCQVGTVGLLGAPHS